MFRNVWVRTDSPVIAAPDFYNPFSLIVDASDCCIWAVPLQKDINGIDHLVRVNVKVFESSARPRFRIGLHVVKGVTRLPWVVGRRRGRGDPGR